MEGRISGGRGLRWGRWWLTTPWKINMEPENKSLEKESPFGSIWEPLFSGSMLNFGGVAIVTWIYTSPHHLPQNWPGWGTATTWTTFFRRSLGNYKGKVGNDRGKNHGYFWRLTLSPMLHVHNFLAILFGTMLNCSNFFWWSPSTSH